MGIAFLDRGTTQLIMEGLLPPEKVIFKLRPKTSCGKERCVLQDCLGELGGEGRGRREVSESLCFISGPMRNLIGIMRKGEEVQDNNS